MTVANASFVDVLIVGAGPAGLMAAAWLSRCGIKTRIIDKRDNKIYRGQADGLMSRTFEIFDSFGFADRAWKESNHMLEMCMWSPNSDGVIQRSSVVVDTVPGISRFQQATLHQGRIEKFFLDTLKEHGNIEVERGVLPESLSLDEARAEDEEAYPITLRLKHLETGSTLPVTDGRSIPNGLFRSNLTPDDTAEMLKAQTNGPNPAITETVKAKYVIGCDGAHSWVRNELGFKLVGEQTDYIWGVLDIVPVTNFPDIRKRGAIHSAHSGSMMIIPRENKIVRVYCQMAQTSNGARIDRSAITPEAILEQARKIIAPYNLSYKHCDWFTAYQIGQRVCPNFSYQNRIFLAGDAVHTHSPKAGQGMNVSMQDSYNLGWKIANVVNGTSSRSILSTYETERRQVAQDLINFDHKFSRLFSGRPARDEHDHEGVNLAEFKAAYVKGNYFTSGISVTYGPSIIVAGTGSGDEACIADVTPKKGLASKQHLAKNIPLGARMPSYQVLNQCDARPWHFQEILKSDGRWRVVVFAGDVTIPRQKERIEAIGKQLAHPEFFPRRFTPSSKPIDSVIEVLTIHSAPRHEVDLFDFPEMLRPFSEENGWDYWKVYVDAQSYHEGHGQAYLNYGVDPTEGCLVVIRPDQHVSYIGGLEDLDAVDRFFSEFWKPVKY